MIKGTILLFIIFLHIQDDFNQGIISQMKKKTWWKENEPNIELCKYDYIVVLLVHGFKTTFISMLPILIYILFQNDITLFISYTILLIFNSITHAIIDNAKCNNLRINLIEDQLLHLLFLVASWIILIVFNYK